MGDFPRLVVICGATATGKTQLALTLAQRFNTIILGADSRQVYRELDIGTAKPSLGDRRLVPHGLIDICDPTATLTLAEYQRQAQPLIENHPGPVFLVGGTGLYIKAITRGLKIPPVPPQPSLRQQLTDLGQGFCYQLLQTLDPTAALKIHPADPVRTLRALEVFYVTGQPISQLQGEDPPAYPILQIGLTLNGDRLEQRINHRTRAMVDQGLVAEVAGLMDRYGADLPVLKTLGYGEMVQYLQGKLTLEEAIQLINRHTCQLAKRQRTWFRADPTIHWFDGEDPNLVNATLDLLPTP